MDVVVPSRRMPSAMDHNLLANRSKLLKLAENIKTRKKPTHKKTQSLKQDPSYTNIEHLVFGTYRSRPSPGQSVNGTPVENYHSSDVQLSGKNQEEVQDVTPISPIRTDKIQSNRGGTIIVTSTPTRCTTSSPVNSQEIGSYYHSLDRSRLLGHGLRRNIDNNNEDHESLDESELSSLPAVLPTHRDAALEMTTFLPIKTGDGEVLLDDDDSYSSKQRPAISRSRQKPPVHLNANRSPPTRLVMVQAPSLVQISNHHHHSARPQVVFDRSKSVNNSDMNPSPLEVNGNGGSNGNDDFRQRTRRTLSDGYPLHVLIREQATAQKAVIGQVLGNQGNGREENATNIPANSANKIVVRISHLDDPKPSVIVSSASGLASPYKSIISVPSVPSRFSGGSTGQSDTSSSSLSNSILMSEPTDTSGDSIELPSSPLSSVTAETQLEKMELKTQTNHVDEITVNDTKVLAAIQPTRKGHAKSKSEHIIPQKAAPLVATNRTATLRRSRLATTATTSTFGGTKTNNQPLSLPKSDIRPSFKSSSCRSSLSSSRNSLSSSRGSLVSSSTKSGPTTKIQGNTKNVNQTVDLRASRRIADKPVGRSDNDNRMSMRKAEKPLAGQQVVANAKPKTTEPVKSALTRSSGAQASCRGRSNVAPPALPARTSSLLNRRSSTVRAEEIKPAVPLTKRNSITTISAIASVKPKVSQRKPSVVDNKRSGKPVNKKSIESPILVPADTSNDLTLVGSPENSLDSTLVSATKKPTPDAEVIIRNHSSPKKLSIPIKMANQQDDLNVHLVSVTSPSIPLPDHSIIHNAATCVKSLPRSSVPSSPEKIYNLEKPNKPLYTWYDTRRHGMLLSPSGVVDESPIKPASPSVEGTPSGVATARGSRLTTSLPKSFLSSRFSAARRDSEPVEDKMVVQDRGRRDTEPVLSPHDKYDEQSEISSAITNLGAESINSRRASSLSSSSTPTSPSPAAKNYNNNNNKCYTSDTPPVDEPTPPPSPRSANGESVSPCGRPHGSTGCLRCSDGGGKLTMELRLLHRDHSMPKCVRRLKASSSPSALAIGHSSELSASDSDLRRPWSQVYSEAEAARVLEAKARVLESVTVPSSTTSSCADLSVSNCRHQVSPSSPSSPTATPKCRMLLPQMSMPSVFSSRCSSLRAPSSSSGRPLQQVGAMESVLQKFRKSFSLRFQRNRRLGTQSPQSSSSLSVADDCQRTSEHVDSIVGDQDVTGGSSVDVEPDGSENDNTVFRFGPIVWRSSKEKKNGNRKDAKNGGVKCSSPDSGIQVEVVSNHHQLERGTSSASSSNVALTSSSTPSSPGPTPSRGGRSSSSFRLLDRRRKRSLTEGLSSASLSTGGSFSGDSGSQQTDLDGSVRQGSPETTVYNHNNFRNHHGGYGTPVLRRRSSGRRSVSVCHQANGLRNNLRRSVSQPLDVEKFGSPLSIVKCQGGHSDHEDPSHSLCNSSDDDDIDEPDVANEPLSDSEMTNNSPSRHRHKRVPRSRQALTEYVTYVEALWDHVTMDPDELAFKAGDLVAVLNCSDRNWWWGAHQDRMGWFPADFVRARVNQAAEVTLGVNGELHGSGSCSDDQGFGRSGVTRSGESPGNVGGLLNSDQIRTNVIKEIVSTERDFVQHLKDVIEGYLKQVRKRPDMFPEERVSTIFGNVEQIHAFQSSFLTRLEECIDWETPHLSCLGACFVQYRDGFQVYSEYCNNHPQALNELQELFTVPKYSHFFEACRLLQDMIDISLDGFLLTPVQKICKYPLQLAELLKFTPSAHPDRPHVAEALQTMRQVAQDINERKRRMECLEKLAAWQMAVEDWEGPDLLDHSSELIYSGDVTKVTSSWSRDLTIFLFDHQLVLCKRDLLKRNTFCYKGRVNTDESDVIDLPDGRDTQSGLMVRHAWRMFCTTKCKWFTFCAKSSDEKSRWMKAFNDERQRVLQDRQQGFVVSDRAKLAAMAVVQNKLKRSKSKNGKEFFPGRRRLTHANKNNNLRHQPSSVTTIGLNKATKTGSLPPGLVLSTSKKKYASGWFAFGGNNSNNSSKKQQKR